ncbi:hypothetical protein Kpol_520p7 [Vanderwaltozyma polyspora DSM 70294]|uniref:Type 2A phosphatase activator TIP41 n=1 Tax=Vanderwaltozyma polyspora (strain ATCC 22028 / DSM 70294 / BCRC 21397 / CBS 2163 / NBRC 10782 / NRRL Y-8283 / UCD 57-17) TaxID=436907 RepID=A7TM92_VANPO|nr:uncharacterized protein Kpol_520p7 [Vanderwaltozyma polyspora DSM 70294]EDO16586.1 hypothetical protein Kpol_520p7 [Vanderwaltozyma polyspora DSM 70294]
MDKKGINTIEISAAREMHSRTISARFPQRGNANSGSTSLPNSTVLPSASTAASFRKPLPMRHICNNPNNPPCANCGTTIIPSPKASLPLEDNPQITINNWKISTRKKPILNSKELDDWESNKLKGLTLPEMIFGNNEILIENKDKNWGLRFNALDALKEVKLQDSGVRVSYSNKWLDSKHKQKKMDNLDIDASSLKIIHNYDWTYTTHYKGTVFALNGEEQAPYDFHSDDSLQLPIDKLSKPDKILFFDDMILFEDELADNGISILNSKIRVMNERLLLLSRFFLRVDEVLIRVIDTRIYVEFDDNYVMRETKVFEGNYNDILSKHKLSHSHDPKAVLRDSDWVAAHTPLLKRECEFIRFD